MGSLPESIKAAFVTQNGGEFHFDVKETPIPQISPDEILVKLNVSGVCGSDFTLAAGKLTPNTEILGHEGVGNAVKLGSAVEETQIKLGDRVGIAWVRDICQKCPCCLTPGEEPRCQEQLDSGRKINGTFAEYAVVPSRYLLRIPDELTVPDEYIAPVLCGGVTAYKAIKVSGAKAGQWMVIFGGGGGVGNLGVQYARAMGHRVIAIDVGHEKKQLCLDAGAEAYIDVAAEEDLTGAVRKVAGSPYGVSPVIVAVGSPRAYQSALELVAPLGTLVCVGIPAPSQLIQVHPLRFIDNGIKIIGSAVGTRQDIIEAIEYVQKGLVKPSIRMTELTQLNMIAQTFGENLWKYVIKF